MMHRLIALLITGLLGGSAGAATDLRPKPVADEFVNPPARAIDQTLLQAAASEAVRNGVATLLARQQAQDNATNLIWPPITRRKIVDYKQVERRYSYNTFKQPIYEYQYRQVLRPKKDSYGNITGYRKVKVRAGRRQVGIKEVKHLVPDKDGPITKTHRMPVYGDDGPDFVPRGWWAVNGMALYVLCQAEMREHFATTDHANALAGYVRRYGLPDHTFDLAWLVAGFGVLQNDQYNELLERLTSKLVDGQIREGDAAGMWGPVSIHRDL